MADTADIQAKLAKLTARQCEILYWLFQGLQYKDIVGKINFGVDTIQLEMSRIYDLFELSHLNREARRAYSFSTVGPLHQQKVRNPGVDCRDGVIDAVEPAPNPATLALVKRDEQEGLIPPRPSVAPQPPPRPSGMTSLPGASSPVPSIIYQHSSPWKDMLLGILGTLLLLSLLVVFYLLLNRGGASQPPATVAVRETVLVPVTVASASGVMAFQTVMVPQTVLVPQTVQVAQTVVVPQTVIVIATPQPGSVPVVAPPVPGAPQNLAGKVASDIPGTKLALGQTVSSVIDSNTKPYDVYAIDLVAGESVQFLVGLSSGCIYTYLLNPGSKSIDYGKNTRAFRDGNCSADFKTDYSPATTGTYFFTLEATNSGVRYTLVVKPN